MDNSNNGTQFHNVYNMQQVKQFTIAHTTSLLVYNKGSDSNTKELIRKFRPEFENVYVASDVKSFISFIDSHNNDLENQEISMVRMFVSIFVRFLVYLLLLWLVYL